VKAPITIIVLMAAFTAKSSFCAEQQTQSKSSSENAGPHKKDVVHLAPHSDAEARQIFTYFPYPAIPAQYRFARISGQALYRLAIDAQGTVTQIKILKRMGVFGDWVADVTALKTLIRWRAKPGSPRVVDIPWTITPGYRYITNEGSHIPRH
jgi:TonB family protein